MALRVLPRASLHSIDVPAPDDATDAVDVALAEQDVVEEAAGNGLSPMEKLQLKVRWFRSTGRLASDLASDGRPLRFMSLVEGMYASYR